MDINVDSLLDGHSEHIKLEGELNLPRCSDYEEKIFVKIDANIQNSNGKYIVDAKIDTKITFICGSCLSKFDNDMNIDMSEIFSKVDLQNDEIWKFSSKDNIISLDEPIITNILINIPMKIKCFDKCKGLCIKCAKNLNKGDCDCDTGFIDPRFEEILKIFKEG